MNTSPRSPSGNTEHKPPVNQAARIVNSHFLQSPYEGKDWDSVRKDLIEEFTQLLDQTATNRCLDELERLPQHPNMPWPDLIKWRISVLKDELQAQLNKDKP